MGVQVHVDLSGFKRKVSRQSLINARKAMANDALAAMDKYVPYLEGNLSKGTSINADGSQIWYTMPYAKAQFYGVVNGYKITHWTTATHPKATKRWDLAMKNNSDDMDKVKDAFIKGLDWKNVN